MDNITDWLDDAPFSPKQMIAGICFLALGIFLIIIGLWRIADWAMNATSVF